MSGKTLHHLKSHNPTSTISHLLVTTQKKSSKKDVLLSKLYNLIPKESLISANNVVVYQLSEKDGSITKLETIDGIPSDKNYLNETLAEGNLLFDSLLEIEQEL